MGDLLLHFQENLHTDISIIYQNASSYYCDRHPLALIKTSHNF